MGNYLHSDFLLPPIRREAPNPTDPEPGAAPAPSADAVPTSAVGTPQRRTEPHEAS